MNDMDIIDLIEEKVNEIAKEDYKDDPCPPRFWVSLDNYDMDNQRIMLMIEHCGYKFTRPIFPLEDTDYGYESLKCYMTYLYNQTM